MCKAIKRTELMKKCAAAKIAADKAAEILTNLKKEISTNMKQSKITKDTTVIGDYTHTFTMVTATKLDVSACKKDAKWNALNTVKGDTATKLKAIEANMPRIDNDPYLKVTVK